VVAHIVFFQPNEDTTSDDKRSFARIMGKVSAEVTSIRRAYVGKAIDINPGYARSFGDTTYSHAAVLEFEDRAGLLEYLQHPTHAELGELFWRWCGATAIIEVETRSLDSAGLGDFLAAE
jgi:hypothetical protein